MPPKSKSQAPSKKADQKKKEKVIEDKTFGLKNKKGAKQQKFIQQVEKQVKSGGVPPRKQQDDKKDGKSKDQKDLNLLFKPVQKVEKGADPKSILCAFFKEGQCTKGAKCKFSHDLTVERKSEKRSIYVDMRDNDSPEDKVKELLDNKQLDEKNRPTTDIVCKYFLDAVEHNNYGWFWNCPNGENCIYRHALPPGYVLKKNKKKDDKKDEISLEDLIERERASLASKQFTKITLESFLAWKKRKVKEKKDKAQRDEDKKKLDYKAGKSSGLSGREMFSFNPELATGDQMEEGDEAFNSYQINEEEEADDQQYKELELDKLGLDIVDVDVNGITQAPDDRLSHHIENLLKTVPADSAAEGDNGAVAINENLFLDDDLGELEEELEDLELNDQ
ncbi:zinc finger CCCH domain-containing protein 15 homolog [Cimex lectularius]|uniref:C3H1-type domain-containing protein n=1 Tax=Cimex lectularius TaxID=79782 RepID=A0A8I6RNX5_CIMLE|nr:zinc finger CCCH domain-containing protein 15 homolog [Cimex lectularius]